VNRFCSLLLAIFLSCQLSFAAAFTSFSIAANEVHQAFSHDQAIDHHHHDSFVTHVDHPNSEPAHQHGSDSFPTSALITSNDFLPVNQVTSDLIAFSPKQPLAVFLDGLLRPPRTFL